MVMGRWWQALLCGLSMATVGCGGEELEGQDDDVVLAAMEDLRLSPDEKKLLLGSKVFLHETFDGNGRTCVTCHTLATGTLSPAQAKLRYTLNPKDPLFRPIDSDDGQSKRYKTLLANATVFVNVPLPPNVTLRDDPNARTVKLRRGIPSVFDMAALDPVIMLDAREPDLMTQAGNAIKEHAQGKRTPKPAELEAVAFFQQKVLFSSKATRDFANGGPMPGLPQGSTASERRGRVFFDGPESLCGSCHSGALLDGNLGPETPLFSRFSNIFVSEVNRLGNPVRDYVFTGPDGTSVIVSSADPGAALTIGDPSATGFFKMTSLRKLSRTAPYFHDNSAATIEEVMEQYVTFFNLMQIPVSDQDVKDMIAYMKIL